jgi:homoserine O-succinyltransferase
VRFSPALDLPDDGPGLTIGLVNLMPESARHRTAAEFERMLDQAPGGPGVRLVEFAVVADPAAQAALFAARLDGLIVTGTEPQSTIMEDEPVWPALAKIIDWAGHNTISTLFSCFAAHAAVYRLDKIRRRPLEEKLHGVFTCGRAAEHSIFAGAPAHWQVPHSRYNTLSEISLRDAGYLILSDAWRVGADSFTKTHRNSQFLFFQGHPEYAADTLACEYRRDRRRYLAGERMTPPKMPEGYCGGELEDGLDWRGAAQSIGASWLSYIAARKAPATTAAATAAATVSKTGAARIAA